MLIIGIDPGLSGAMSVLDFDNGFLEGHDLPVESNGLSTGPLKRWIDVRKLKAILKDVGQRYEFAKHAAQFVIERPMPMPGQTVHTAFSSGDTFGALRAICETSNNWVAEVVFVAPATWKRDMGLSTDKGTSIARALDLYPNAAPWMTLKKHHDRAESILLAHWMRERL
jgi:hypothetical protein